MQLLVFIFIEPSTRRVLKPVGMVEGYLCEYIQKTKKTLAIDYLDLNSQIYQRKRNTFLSNNGSIYILNTSCIRHVYGKYTHLPSLLPWKRFRHWEKHFPLDDICFFG